MNWCPVCGKSCTNDFCSVSCRRASVDYHYRQLLLGEREPLPAIPVGISDDDEKELCYGSAQPTGC